LLEKPFSIASLLTSVREALRASIGQ
jgi:hypothetical protein